MNCVHRLYADEDFHPEVVRELRRLGHDALTVQEAGQGNRGIEDAEVLAFAVGDGRAVLTFNRRHFIRLHQRSAMHSGIIVCSRDVDTYALAVRIDRAITEFPTLDCQLFRIDRPPTPRLE